MCVCRYIGMFVCILVAYLHALKSILTIPPSIVLYLASVVGTKIMKLKW